MAHPATINDLSGARWHKSTHSNGGEGGCIEVADNLSGVVTVRDSKDPDGPALVFAPAEWRSFVQDLKDGPPLLHPHPQPDGRSVSKQTG